MSPSPVRLRCGVVLAVGDERCHVVADGEVLDVGFAPQFPTPYVERVSPGHLVALATSPRGTDVVIWRWYDAVVLADEPDGVRLWEPAHGEVVAQRRTAEAYERGFRAYASAGLPGAQWWVASAAAPGADVDLDEVERLYTDNELWEVTFGE